MKTLTVFLFAVAAMAQPTLPNAVPFPNPEIQFVDQFGAPLAGAKLCTYAAGTSTPLATYTSSTAGTPNTNPITLDSAGRASVWVGPALYKFVLRTGGTDYPASDACTTGTIQWTQDQVGDLTLYFANYVKTVGTCTLITFAATGTGAVTRTCSSKLGDIVSAKDFGATGDGTTNDTVAFTNAIAAVVAAGGGAVLVTEGVYRICRINLPTTAPIMIRGDGTDSTTLKLINACDNNAISQANFAALTGTNSTGGVFRIDLRDFTIDGNKANQTVASDCIALYGHGFRISNVYIQNCKGRGLWSEWGLDSTFTTPADDLESYFVDMKTMFNDSDGFMFRGPHDSMIVNHVTYRNGGWGFQNVGTAVNSSTVHINGINSFLNTSGGCHFAAGVQGSHLQCRGANTWGALAEGAYGPVDLSNVEFSSDTTGYALEVRNNGATVAGGTIGYSPDGALYLNSGSGTFLVNFFLNGGPAVKLAGTRNDSFIHGAGLSSNAADACVSGAPNSSESIDLRISGTAPCAYKQIPTATIHAAGWAPQLPATNAVLSAPDTTETITGDKTYTKTITSTLADGFAPFVVTSKTSPVNLNAHPTLYDNGGTYRPNGHAVIGNVTLSTGSATVTLAGSAVYTSAASYACSFTNLTAQRAVQVVYTSGSQFTLTGSGSDNYIYQCVGY